MVGDVCDWKCYFVCVNCCCVLCYVVYVCLFVSVGYGFFGGEVIFFIFSVVLFF